VRAYFDASLALDRDVGSRRFPSSDESANLPR